MNFSDITAITIPEGSVSQITDSDGNILWSAGPAWQTVFSGSKNIWAQGTSSATANLSSISVIADLGVTTLNNLSVRITFTINTDTKQSSSSCYRTYYSNNLMSTTKPISPHEIQTVTIPTVTVFGGTNWLMAFRYQMNSSTATSSVQYIQTGVTLYKSSSSSNWLIRVQSLQSSSSGNYKPTSITSDSYIDITITKVEVIMN